VERALKEAGKSREELGREAFVERVWQWKEEYGNTILRQNIQASDRTFIQNIDTYQSDFGTQEVILHRYQRRERLSFMERNKLRIAVLRPVLATELAKVGSSTKGMIEWEGTLEVLAPNAIGYIDNADTVL
jgi:hypothetical protein